MARERERERERGREEEEDDLAFFLLFAAVCLEDVLDFVAVNEKRWVSFSVARQTLSARTCGVQ